MDQWGNLNKILKFYKKSEVQMEVAEERLRLLVVSYSLSGGGAERFTSTLLSHIDRSRFQPSLVLMSDNISYPLPPDIPLWILEKNKPWHIFHAIGRLKKIIMRIRPHVVLSSIAYTARITSEALKGCSAQPYWVARIGGNPAFEDKGPLNAFNKVWNRCSYKHVDEFVTNSRGLAQELTEYYPFTSGRVTTIFTPVDFEKIDRLAEKKANFNADPYKSLVICVGRIDKGKRPDVLLQSFQKLCGLIPAELWICGDGPLKGQIARDIADRGLSDSVKLLGFQENPYALMQQANLFLMTSDHEGLPNALIEAQGMGLPAVSTNCPYGPDEIIEDGKTGILVERGDSLAVTKAMEELLVNKERREKMAKAAKKRARRLFDTSSQIRKWEKVLEDSRTENTPL